MMYKQYMLIITSVFFLSNIVFTLNASAGNNQLDRIVSLGTSLTDSGNAFILLSNPDEFGFSSECGLGTPLNVPPYDQLDESIIPDGTYARGGHHVTNGATWVEQLARGKGLSGNVRPALRNNNKKASNYAVGGARANEISDISACRFNLSDQLGEYLSDFNEISAKTLVTFEFGGNDVRDALVALIQGQDPSLIIESALNHIGTAIAELYAQGARKILLLNVPPIGNTPAVMKLQNPDLTEAANGLAWMFNEGLSQLQEGLSNSLPGISISTLDLFGLFNEIVENSAAYGLVNITEACVTPEQPPFACKKPDTYLFWDGIHPTKAVHGIMAQKAAEVISTMP